ncbi:MAG TPA: hypothetical protein VHC22_32525 [Pirellulales bacterium]|nr:hypothetical protein [Pirellulales bacterium]
MSLTLRGRIFRSTSAIVAARIEDPETAQFAQPGTPLLAEQFSAIAYSVTDTLTQLPVDNDGTLYSGLPLTPADVIFDTLQPWPEDSRGYNFKLVVGPGAFPQSEREYSLEVNFALTDGRIGEAVFAISTEQVWSG